MKIVIDIDEELYKYIKDIPKCYRMAAHRVIADGTPLPKGHGRLIDADALYDYVANKYSEGEQLAIDITDAPTIIEAERGEE